MFATLGDLGRTGETPSGPGPAKQHGQEGRLKAWKLLHRWVGHNADLGGKWDNAIHSKLGWTIWHCIRADAILLGAKTLVADAYARPADFVWLSDYFRPKFGYCTVHLYPLLTTLM
jgi:hypothetical protein